MTEHEHEAVIVCHDIGPDRKTCETCACGWWRYLKPQGMGMWHPPDIPLPWSSWR